MCIYVNGFYQFSLWCECFWIYCLFIDKINILALREFCQPEWLLLKTQTFQCIACCIISQIERDYMYNQWCWYVILPLHNSIWGSVVTNCFSFRGSITYYYLEFYLLPKKKIIPLPLIVGGNCIQQELTYRHKQALVSQYLTWYTELTPDCDHIYF